MVKRGLKQRHYVAFLTAMDSELENYIGGQLKINLEPRRRRDQHAFTYRGVIEDVEVDGNQVQVSLEWVAKTNVGKYTLDTNFDLDLSFAIERMTEDGVGNLRIITEQGEEMTFFQKGRHDNIQPENVIGFRFAVPRREQRGLLQPFKGKPMVTKIRVDYVDGSYDKFSTLTGGKETVGCYCWDGFHFQPFTLDKAIPAEDVAQFLLNVSTNGKFVPTPDASSVTSRENFTSEEGLTGPEIDAVVRGASPLGSEPDKNFGKTASKVAIFLAFWLLPLFGMELQQRDTGSGITVWGIWFISVPLIAWLYKRFSQDV